MTHGFRLFAAVVLTGSVALGCGMLTGPDGTEPLTIERFLATPGTVRPEGGKVTLLWSVEGADSVTIDHGIGEVEPKGSMKVVVPGATRTMTFTLTALWTDSTATATVRVAVGSESPSPSPSPSPSSSPSPAPSASPSPSPSPSSSPSPNPTTPTIGLNGCGRTASLAGCTVSVEQPTILPPGECVQVTRLSATPGCPVAVGTTRTVSFDVTAQTASVLAWRRTAGGTDTVTPDKGSLVSRGVTAVTTTAVVRDEALGFEVVDSAGRVLLRFTTKHR